MEINNCCGTLCDKAKAVSEVEKLIRLNEAFDLFVGALIGAALADGAGPRLRAVIDGGLKAHIKKGV